MLLTKSRMTTGTTHKSILWDWHKSTEDEGEDEVVGFNANRRITEDLIESTTLYHDAQVVGLYLGSNPVRLTALATKSENSTSAPHYSSNRILDMLITLFFRFAEGMQYDGQLSQFQKNWKHTRYHGWLTLQHGQTYPLIFEIIPIIRRFIFLQKLISFLIVFNAMSCGVVTITAPSGETFLSAFTTVKCSSDVPGGVSTRE